MVEKSSPWRSGVASYSSSRQASVSVGSERSSVVATAMIVGMTALLVVLALGFAFSIGAHYTGACMGMPHALRAISAWRALLLMAPLAFLGALLASHGVEHRVGFGLTHASLSVGAQAVVVGVAFALTTLFNRLRLPTSTIQILVFSLAGVALATG